MKLFYILAAVCVLSLAEETEQDVDSVAAESVELLKDGVDLSESASTYNAYTYAPSVRNPPSRDQSYIPSNFQNYIPPSVQNYKPPNFQNYIPNSQNYIPSNVQNFIPSSTQNYIPSNIQNFIPSSTQKYPSIVNNFQNYIPTTPSTIQNYIPPVPSNVQNYIPSNVQNYIPSVPSNVQSDVPVNNWTPPKETPVQPANDYVPSYPSAAPQNDWVWYPPHNHPSTTTSTVLKNEVNFGDNGSYNYEYHIANGAHVSEEGYFTSPKKEDDSLVKRGWYSYPGADGKVYSVTWWADKTGYHAFGDHLPKPSPAVQAAIDQAAKEQAQAEAEKNKPQHPSYPPHQITYPPQNSHYPPQQTYYPPQQTYYPNQQSHIHYK